MAFKYEYTSFTSNGDFVVTVIGDGTSTSVTFALEESPFNLQLKGNLPVDVAPFAPGVTLSLSTDRKKVTIAFDVAPDAGVYTNIAVNLIFAGI